MESTKYNGISAFIDNTINLLLFVTGWLIVLLMFNVKWPVFQYSWREQIYKK